MRSVLNWVLWNQRNARLTAAGIAAAVIVVIVALTAVGGGSSRPAPTAESSTPAASASAATTTTSPTPTGDSLDQPVARPTATVPAGGEQDETPANPARDAATATAATRAYVNMWLAGRTKGNGAFVASVRAMVDPSFLPFLAATPASAIPNAKIAAVGAPKLAAGQATVPVTLTDKTAFAVTLMRTGGKWLVTNTLPA